MDHAERPKAPAPVRADGIEGAAAAPGMHRPNRCGFSTGTGSGRKAQAWPSSRASPHRLNLPYRAVFRKPGEPVPVPSIVHWKVGHFAAIVGKADGRFHIEDPVLGRDGLWVTKAALDAEASGYFLAPVSEASAAAWRPVAIPEAGEVWGAGSTERADTGRSQRQAGMRRQAQGKDHAQPVDVRHQYQGNDRGPDAHGHTGRATCRRKGCLPRSR